ncbi:MAG: SDR family NAD(P)-dependent oxidoreductase [Lachnospiraceae bacterium]|nr:SDR family NAD(P)-dependent oxidoreductase [Lachnospiraceae bacterium]
MGTFDKTRKNAIITGASRGIGKMTAIKFAKEGYNLSLACNTNASLLKELKDFIEKEYGVTVLTFEGDLSNPENIKNLFSVHEAHYERLDCLINNAGMSIVGLFQDISYADFQKILNVNFSSAFLCSQEAVKLMLKEKKGAIVNVSSVWGEVGASCEVAYSATKGAINAFTRALGKELAPSGISVNAVSFGMVDTDMNSCFTEEEVEDIKKDIPAGRVASPEDASEILYSVATSNSYLTGQIIRFDGGWI